jgi:ficolin
MAEHNGMQFSTIDVENHMTSSVNCADKMNGGWWYNACFRVNLNGLYEASVMVGGIYWQRWVNYRPMKTTSMMIRRQP